MSLVGVLTLRWCAVALVVVVTLAVWYDTAIVWRSQQSGGRTTAGALAGRSHVPGREEYRRFEELLNERNKQTNVSQSTARVDEVPDAAPAGDAKKERITVSNVQRVGAFESFLTHNAALSYLTWSSQRAKSGARRRAAKATLPLCTPPRSGVSDIAVELLEVPVEKDLVAAYSKTVQVGGHWRPQDCIPDERLAIIIPFRTRELHLLFFLKYMHRFLQRQRLHYSIFVVDQNAGSPFNRAMLFNVGFVEALREDKLFTCFVFHDVDHIPVDDFLSYRCGDEPVHMAAMTDKWEWGLPYPQFTGGVTKQSTLQTLEINGFSNNFWGWGGEDDDIRQRWLWAGFRFKRPSGGHGRYATVKLNHSRSSDPNPNRMKLLRESRKRVTYDGLNTLHYHVVEKHRHQLYTRIRVLLKRIALR